MASSLSGALVLEDINLVSRIVSCLRSPQDRLSSSLVCRLWNEAVIFKSFSLAIRSRTLLHRLLDRFPNVKEVDLGHCCDELEDPDFQSAVPFLHRIQRLLVGHPGNPQNKLSEEGFLLVACYCTALKHIELSSLPAISDRVIICLANGCPKLENMFLQDCVNVGDPAIEAIAKCRKLQEITLKGQFGVTARGLGVIGEHCSTLRRVRFEMQDVDVGFALKSISTGCPHMLEISLKARRVDIAHLANCTTLICLRVESDVWNLLDESMIAVMAANKDLEELVIVNQSEALSDMDLARVIKSCQKLEKLQICAARLTGTALRCLMDCKTLKCVALDFFNSSAQAMAEVSFHGLDLKHLSLKFGMGGLDAELQTLVQGSPSLELLDLQCCLVLSPIGFSAISRCTRLQSLNLSFTEVDNVSLQTIADCVRSLKQLSLVKCESISDMGVIARFSMLESLNLDKCPFVADESLGLLAMGCSQLTHLSLAFTQITDKGLFCLTQCGQLRSLRIPYCRNVKGPGLIAIATACTWFRFVVLSYKFRGSDTLVELKRRFCMVKLQVDEMGLVVPIGLNIVM